MFRRRGGNDGSIRVPPGGHVRLEISQDGKMRVVGQEQVERAVLQDPIGGPPLEVSSEVVPDAKALYLLSTCIIECTRQLASHEAATRSHDAVVEQACKAQERATFWSRSVFITCTCLAVVGAVNFAIAMWGALHGH